MKYSNDLIKTITNVNWEDVLSKNIRYTAVPEFDFSKPIIKKKDDYAKLRDIVNDVEDYFGIRDISCIKVRDLFIYVREMVRG